LDAIAITALAASRPTSAAICPYIEPTNAAQKMTRSSPSTGADFSRGTIAMPTSSPIASARLPLSVFDAITLIPQLIEHLSCYQHAISIGFFLKWAMTSFARFKL
jgi:hypothetical protein